MADLVGTECDFVGHSWMDAGGGLEICGLCETERWANADRIYDEIWENKYAHRERDDDE